MARFSDIERAEELLAAKAALEAWRKLSNTAKKAAYAQSRMGLRTNTGKQFGFIRPFGGSDNFFYKTKVLATDGGTPTAGEENESSLINAVVGAVIQAAAGKGVMTNIPTGTNVVIKTAKKIEFAKVRVQIPTTNTRQRISRFTNKSYTQREVKSVSCSFGAGTSTQTEQQAREAILTALKTALPTAIVTFKPQGFVGD